MNWQLIAILVAIALVAWGIGGIIAFAKYNKKNKRIGKFDGYCLAAVLGPFLTNWLLSKGEGFLERMRKKGY